MWAAQGVAEGGNGNVSVAKVEDGLGPIRREPSELEEEGNLYSVAPMLVLLLCCG